MQNIIKRICKIAKNAPINNFIRSYDNCVTELKMEFNLDNKTLCEILSYMKHEGLIRDFGYQYSDANPDVIYRYWFR